MFGSVARSPWGARTHGSGEHAGIEPEGIAHERHRRRRVAGARRRARARDLDHHRTPGHVPGVSGGVWSPGGGARCAT